ncbi:MAG: hypothetical protein LUG45_11660 [Clostridiales bacterium]|nr:hypothetical protein [Clostridiales bacterium]
MTYYYRFTNYEKMALCAFGCSDKEQTIDNLKIAALIAVQEETRAKLERLANRLKDVMVFTANYRHDFYLCVHEMEQGMIQEALDYQAATGDLENGWPWKNYGMAQLVNAFCNEDYYPTMNRLGILSRTAVMPAFGSILTAVMITVSSIHEEMPEEYGSYLNRCREIVRRGELRKKKGKDKYRQYVWQTPSVMPEWR